jgi:hypothetical protein
MNITQESKYDAVDGKIVNRATGKAIPDEEPIIIFRAKDIKANVAMQAYLDVIKDPVHKQVIQERLEDFIAFQNTTELDAKEPDSDISCLNKYKLK